MNNVPDTNGRTDEWADGRTARSLGRQFTTHKRKTEENHWSIGLASRNVHVSVSVSEFWLIATLQRNDPPPSGKCFNPALFRSSVLCVHLSRMSIGTVRWCHSLTPLHSTRSRNNVSSNCHQMRLKSLLFLASEIFKRIPYKLATNEIVRYTAIVFNRKP